MYKISDLVDTDKFIGLSYNKVQKLGDKSINLVDRKLCTYVYM